MKDSYRSGRYRREDPAKKEEKRNEEYDPSSRRRARCADIVMVIGCITVLFFFASALRDAPRESPVPADAVEVSSVEYRVNEFSRDEKFDLWEYFSECLEKIFFEKGLRA